MKKYRLNEALASYDTFLTKTNEAEMTSSMSASVTPASAATVSDVRVDADYINNLSTEIDTIINGLKDISIHLEPEAIEESENQLNESLTSTFFDGDPIFPLLAGGVAGILSIFGFGAKAIIDGKRNKKLGAQVEGDYNTLKGFKVKAVQLEIAEDLIQNAKDANKADEATVTNKRPSNTPANREDGPTKPASAAKKKGMQLDAKLQAIKKKKEDANKAAEEFQSNLDEKYSKEALEGFFSGKVRKLIAFKKNEIANTVAKLKLKHLSGEMEPEEKARIVDLIKDTDADMKAALASVQTEDQESENKVEANKDKIIEQYNEAIDKLEASKEGKEGKEAIVVDMKIVGFKMQIAKLEKDTEKVDLFKGKLNDLRKKISELGNEEPATTEEPKAEEPKAEEPKAEEPVKNSKDDKLSRVDALIKKEEEKIAKNPEAEKIKSKISEFEQAIEDLKNKEKKEKADQDKINVINAALSSEKKKLDKATGSEKLNKLKDLKDKISAKESWQLEGTELGRIFEMEIKRFESMFSLNESLSVKDAFSRLI